MPNGKGSCVRVLCQEKLGLCYNNGYDIYVNSRSVEHSLFSYSVVKHLSETLHKVKELGVLSSTFIELLAIKHFVKIIVTNGHRKFVIFSDSKSAMLLIIISKRDLDNQIRICNTRDII